MAWLPTDSLTPSGDATPIGSVRRELINAVIQQESGGRANPPDAGKGAIGLMQIKPETARAYGFDPNRLADPTYNREAGTGILAALLKEHNGDEREALKSYYGRGVATKGAPTTDEYADQVLARAGGGASGTIKGGKWVPTSGLQGPTEMRTGPGPLMRGGEEALRTGAFMAGEYGGGALGALGGGAAGTFVAPGPGTVTGGLIGAKAGSAVGAGAASTLADAVTAFINHKLYGTPIDISTKSVLEDAGINTAASAFGQVAGPVVTGLGSKTLGAAVGKPELVAGAKETFAKAEGERAAAESKQAASNLKERTSAYESAQTQAAKEQESAQAKVAKEREGAEAEAAKQRATAAGAQQKFGEQHAKMQQDTTEQIGKLRDKAIKEQTPAAQQAAVTSVTGRTPEVSARQLNEPAQASIGRKQQFYQTIRAPLKRFSDRWAMNRDHVLAGQADSPVNIAPLKESVDNQLAWIAANNKDVSPPLKKLIGKIESMTPIETGKPDLAAMLKGKGKSAVPVSNEDWARLQAQMEGGEPPSLPNVRGMLGIRSEASRIADASTGHNRMIAREIVDGVDASFAKDPALNAKLPALAKLNQEWRHHKEVFGDLQDKVGDVTIPTDIGKDMFDQPRVAVEWATMATPQERVAAKKLYGDWVNNQLRDGKNLDQIVSPNHADFMKILAPGTPFATPEGIQRITTKTMALDDLLRTSPEVQQKFMQSFIPAARQQTEAGMNEVTKEALAQAQKMGPIGQQIRTAIENAKTPAGKFTAAVKAMTGADPEQIVAREVPEPVLQSQSPEAAMQATAAAQKSPEAAGREAVAGMFPKRAVPPTTPEEAAIAAIQAGTTGKSRGASYFIERARHLWPIYAAVGAQQLAQGRMSYSGVMLALGAGSAALGPIKRAFAKSLENPETARAFWNAIDNPAAPSSMAKIAQSSANALISDVTSEGLKSATGVSLEGNPNSDKIETGPGVEALQKSKNEHLAPTASAADRAAKVSTDMSKGKTPEVHKDLNRGRLSMDEVDKLLKVGSRKDAMALLENVPLSESVDAAEVATPAERAILLPLIAQKMQAQIKTGKYNRTLVANLAQRLKALQSGGVSGTDQERPA